MSGTGTISVNQTPQYGDKTALDAASKAVTSTPMTGNAAPAPSAGRPPGSGGDQPAQVPVSGAVPAGHAMAAQDLARKAWAAKEWAKLAASPQAGPRIRMYAEAAQKNFESAMNGVRNQTPFFE